MPIRGIGDGYASGRLVWLLLGMVIVPAVGLSAIGFAAIGWQGAALEAEHQARSDDQLRQVATLLSTEIRARDRQVRIVAEGCPANASTPCAIATRGAHTVWVWEAETSPPPELAVVGVPSEAAETAWLTSLDTSSPIGVFKLLDGNICAWLLDVVDLSTWLKSGPLTEPGASQNAFSLTRLKDRSGLAELVPTWPATQTDAELPLSGALAGYVLELQYLPDAPERSRRVTNAMLMVTSLLLLLGTVVVGTAMTLRQALREIRLSQLQTDFVSSVSHELRTPLTSIRMFVDTLQSGRLQDRGRIDECLHLLGQETDRLSRMIERVLDWARMEAGRRIYEVEEVRVEVLAGDALAAFRSQTLLGNDDTEILVNIPSDIPALNVDRDAIAEALLNLIHNAFKYTPAPRRISITAVEDGSRVGISVADNGPGIPRKDRKRIFEKFYQADTRLNRPVEGSGLGLAIVRTAVNAHHGKVELHSELNRGSRFTLWLPKA